jgi:hypothetical protein
LPAAEGKGELHLTVHDGIEAARLVALLKQHLALVQALLARLCGKMVDLFLAELLEQGNSAEYLCDVELVVVH